MKTEFVKDVIYVIKSLLNLVILFSVFPVKNIFIFIFIYNIYFIVKNQLAILQLYVDHIVSD